MVLPERTSCHSEEQIWQPPGSLSTEGGALPSQVESTCIPSLLRHKQRVPGAVAVNFDGAALTYGELNNRANYLAVKLRELGVGPETLVGLFVERSLEMLVGILGILKSGGAYLPLDPSYPEERLAFMLEDAQPKVLLTQGKLLSSCLDPKR